MLLDFYNLYLPIAELNINAVALVCLGLLAGTISGMCGIGGGVILLPIITSLGVPIHIAITTSLNQTLAISFSSSLIYGKKNLIDYYLSLFLIIGGFIGIIFGILLYHWLHNIGQLELFVSIGFLVTLISVGMFNAKEVAMILYYKYKKITLPKSEKPKWLVNFNIFKVKLVSSEPISLLLPILLGILSGAAVYFLGLGGGLIMTPVLIYIFGISSKYVVGTVNFQNFFITMVSYYLHAIDPGTVDLMLAVPLLIGTIFGSQLGTKIGINLSRETFKVMVATVALLLCAKVGFELFVEPGNIYEVEIMM